MDNQKFNLFLDRLLKKTEQGKLEWEKTADRDTLLLVLKDSAVSIVHDIEYVSREKNYRGYHFDFRNESGDIVESVTVSNKEEYEKAEKIYNLAQKQSPKINKTLDSILEQLAA